MHATHTDQQQSSLLWLVASSFQAYVSTGVFYQWFYSLLSFLAVSCDHMCVCECFIVLSLLPFVSEFMKRLLCGTSGGTACDGKSSQWTTGIPDERKGREKKAWRTEVRQAVHWLTDVVCVCFTPSVSRNVSSLSFTFSLLLPFSLPFCIDQSAERTCNWSWKKEEEREKGVKGRSRK